MPRLIRHDADAPIRIDPQNKPIYICACGLSQNIPYCDGSHKNCKSESLDKLYIYDDERKQVIEERER